MKKKVNKAIIIVESDNNLALTISRYICQLIPLIYKKILTLYMQIEYEVEMTINSVFDSYSFFYIDIFYKDVECMRESARIGDCRIYIFINILKVNKTYIFNIGQLLAYCIDSTEQPIQH